MSKITIWMATLFCYTMADDKPTKLEKSPSSKFNQSDLCSLWLNDEKCKDDPELMKKYCSGACSEDGLDSAGKKYGSKIPADARAKQEPFKWQCIDCSGPFVACSELIKDGKCKDDPKLMEKYCHGMCSAVFPGCPALPGDDSGLCFEMMTDGKCRDDAKLMEKYCSGYCAGRDTGLCFEMLKDGMCKDHPKLMKKYCNGYCRAGSDPGTENSAVKKSLDYCKKLIQNHVEAEKCSEVLGCPTDS